MKLGAMWVVLLGTIACGRHRSAPSCRADNECSGGEVCFANGCGDPGRGIAVEVSVNPAAGQQPQDFLLAQVHPVEDLSLSGPSGLKGNIDRKGQGGTPYKGKIAFHVVGQSAIIPGLVRTYDAAIMTEGSYAIAAGTGNYNVSAVPADTSIPPLTQMGVNIQPATVAELPVHLPDAASLTQVSGTLFRTLPSTPVPGGMQVQIFNSSQTNPLSQQVTVGADGSFSAMALLASPQTPFVVLATPLDSAVLMPSKAFPLADASTLPLQLELGEYGGPVDVTGRAVTTSGAPISGAVIYIKGTAKGGGTFQTTPVQTDASGMFTVHTLQGQSPGSLLLWAVPAASSPAGLLRAAIEVAAARSLGDVTCPNKVQVRGTVVRPDGGPYLGAKVTATPVNPVDALALPSTGAQTDTVAGGHFMLSLDPALYRLDFTTNDPLPRLTRYISISADPTSAGMDLQPFAFSKGRTVTGQVRAPMALQDKPQVLAPYASVRFFRLPTEGAPTGPVLLAEGATDASGQYSVILPTR